MTKAAASLPIRVESVLPSIKVLRGQKVLLDADLAVLYGVTTSNLNKAVKRNLGRFPKDFMFQVNRQEAATLRFQNGTSKRKQQGGRRYRPYAFTEQGVAMLSSVLKSARAVSVNIAIMRAFVALREAIATNRELAQQFAELEKRVGFQGRQIQNILDTIREMLAPAGPNAVREIGFHVKE